MEKLFLTLFILLTLVACDTERSKMVKQVDRMSDRERQAVAKMKWVDSQNPEKDISKAIASNDCRYLATAGRAGIQLLGVTESVSRAAIDAQNYRVLDGMGDVIVGAVHKKYRIKTKEYMLAYNQSLEGSNCSKKN